MSTPSDPPVNEDVRDESPTWTYPTRLCRLCHEDVPPTVTMYPPGIPLRFQRPVVEYKNEDEYGRLIKPCMCRGTARYIHELCLQRLRTQSTQAGSLWKCQNCGFEFRFERLAVQRFLSSTLAAGILTVVVMFFIIFVLGFVADPILNFYVDPYDEFLDRDSIWDELEIRIPIPGAKSAWFRNIVNGITSAWSQHFMKGMLSMSVVGFLKTLVLNPYNWFYLRSGTGLTGGTRMMTTGRDRAMNINLIVILVGMFSAFFFFYRWMQTVIQIALRRVSSHVVNTQLSTDDDDLKPPSGWKYKPSGQEQSEDTSAEDTQKQVDEESKKFQPAGRVPAPTVTESTTIPRNTDAEPIALPENVGRSTGIDTALGQTWSFANV